ncbi:MAG: hypothetical protein JWN98_570 [Abditibacteriota bacterium]|nr:hypothetical protein [Abditibacteriota bacterium]
MTMKRFLISALCMTCSASQLFSALADENHAPVSTLAQPANTTAAPKVLSFPNVVLRKSVWAQELAEPQGIVRDADGSILVAEYGGGRLVRFSPDGSRRSVVATGLKSPAMLARSGKTILIAERKANRVVRLERNGRLTPIGGAIEEPLGIVFSGTHPVVVSHTTSRLLRWDGRAWQPFYVAPQGSGKRYGYRCVEAEPGGALLLTDEGDGQVLILTPGGRIATWTQSFDSPSGIAIGPDGIVYVADEGETGSLSRVRPDGTVETIATDLGKPRGLLFLDARTLLVTNRQGSIWRLDLATQSNP